MKRASTQIAPDLSISAVLIDDITVEIAFVSSTPAKYGMVSEIEEICRCRKEDTKAIVAAIFSRMSKGASVHRILCSYAE